LKKALLMTEHKYKVSVDFEIVNDNVYVYDIQDCRQDTDKNLL
jgi:hypothetical protein